MKPEEQALLWLKGKSVHNKERDECCPDFSCCRPELLAPLEVRQVFYNAELKGDERTKNRLLGEFLGRLLSSALPEKKVHIAGLDASRQEIT